MLAIKYNTMHHAAATGSANAEICIGFKSRTFIYGFPNKVRNVLTDTQEFRSYN